MMSVQVKNRNIQELADLAKLLRENGDKVLSASSKLSLSASLLHNLNEEFAAIINDTTEDLESSFQVCNSSRIDIFRDVKFLHDFVQKTVSLKVVRNTTEQNLTIDISKFRQLRFLEFHKVSIEFVKGLQAIRGQLESIICTGGRGVGSLSNLLVSCGGDAGAGFVWGSLRRLVLPYNNLPNLDKSLELVPWLQTLDLSHNKIARANEVSHLSSLKCVNFGYNKLEAVPMFSKSVSHSLQVLVLSNNYIDSLNGLQTIECLTELDLSYNCLTEHTGLWPLQNMSALIWLSLEGNPLAYHRRHRVLTLKQLHPCLVGNKFTLDHHALSKSEKSLIGENRIFGIKSSQAELRDDSVSLTNSLNSLVTSIDSSANDSLMTKSQNSELTQSMERSIVKGKKKQNVKEAVIAEDDHEKDDSFEIKDTLMSTSYLEMSMEHLETKKQISALREKFGEDYWLSSHAGKFVQDIMGLEQSVSPNSLLSSTPIGPTSFNVAYDRAILASSIPDYESNSSISQVQSNDELEVKENLEASTEEPTESESQITEIPVPEETYDPEEETGDLYIVQRKKGLYDTEELFLIVTSEDIKERDLISGKVKFRWATSTVLSCVMGRGDPTTVDIIFDTTRKDRQNRTYFLELDEAKKIVATLSELMKARPILLKVFKCMKCSTHFSQDEEYTMTVTSVSTSGARAPKCPSCNSTLVIQTDELLTPDPGANSVEVDIKNDSKESSEVKSTLHHSESHSSIGSATSLEGSRESTPSTGVNKKYESDIEVLSNPSQSSIEVLDEANKTPSRKKSSEERRIAVAPTLLTIPDTAPVMTGLTESSSSGSLTDSICTAYENKTIKDEMNNISSSTIVESEETNISEKEASYTPVSNLTSMLGGLLQSMKLSSGSYNYQPKIEDSLDFVESDMEYSYADFSNVDHRLKLHILLNVFERETEELVLLLRSEIVTPTNTETFSGCLLLSTSKVYVLRISGNQKDDPQKWLHKEVSWTIDRLRSFAPLPFKQGILIELEQPSRIGEDACSTTISCILQDFQRTSNFLFYLTDLSLPASCEVEFTVPSHCTSLIQSLLQSSKNHSEGEPVTLWALFSSATLMHDDELSKVKVGGIVITKSTLLVMQDKMQWLIPNSSQVPVLASEQAMSNLLEVETGGTSLSLRFLDEIAGVEVSWDMNFVSPEATEAVINSIQPSWEELFSVPLQVTKKPATDNTQQFSSTLVAKEA